jgi:hypothetical protein
MENKQDYQEFYKNFLTSYSSGDVSAESVGKSICDLTQFYVDENIESAMTEIQYNKVLSVIEQTTDENGKMTSSAKAKTIAESRPEYEKYLLSKTHRDNIDQILKSLKALQQGIIIEFRNVSNT